MPRLAFHGRLIIPRLSRADTLNPACQTARAGPPEGVIGECLRESFPPSVVVGFIVIRSARGRVPSRSYGGEGGRGALIFAIRPLPLPAPVRRRLLYASLRVERRSTSTTPERFRPSAALRLRARHYESRRSAIRVRFSAVPPVRYDPFISVD